MNRQEINLIGGGFQHSLSTSGFEPLYVKWIKGDETSQISIYVDQSIISPTNPKTKNYGWLCESKTINPDLYNFCFSNIEYLKQNFKYVFTHDVELSKTSDIFKLVQCSGKSFIPEGKIYNKTKLVSMIASNKQMCKEHRYRQQIISKFSNKCDHYGWGYNPITDKLIGLKDYCFSITMENATYSNMFTEKLTDCFMTGTVPVYYGMANIGEFFNIDGIIILDENFKIEDLTYSLYLSKLEYIVENFNIAKNMLVSEDYIFKHYLSNEI